jgi:DNA processing protein
VREIVRVDDADLGFLMAVAGALVWTPRLLRAWLDAFGSARAIIAWVRSQTEPLPAGAEPLSPAAMSRVAAIDERAAERAVQELARSGARAITDSDATYPAALRDLCDPPPVLYVRGDIAFATGRNVAIVGSRAATGYGRQVAGTMAADLGAFGACVVSGLARGIDAAAHRGALGARVRTAAVIGSGLSALYPAYHSMLADEIVGAGGAILSEFPPSMHALAHHFPMRNRIVAALAGATVVVEAGSRSGALITARLADEFGRHVFAVPGDVGRAASVGTNALIRDGVTLATGASDIAHALRWEIVMPAKADADDRDPVLALFGSGGTTVEELQDRTGLDVPSLLAHLTLLEIRGLVERLPGGAFATVKAGDSPKRRST